MNEELKKAALAALIPVSGYVVAFCHEWGYCSYFGIPANLISVSLTNVLIAFVASLLGWPLFTMLANFVHVIPAPIFYRFRELALLWLGGTFWVGLVADLSGIVLWFSLSVLFVVLSEPVLSWREYVVNFFRRWKGLPDWSPPAKTNERPLPFPYIAITQKTFQDLLVAVVLLVVAFDVGYNQAASQRIFPVVGESVVARIYGDTIIRIRFTPAIDFVRHFEKTFYISKISDKDQLNMTYTDLGVLKPVGWINDSSQDWISRFEILKQPLSLEL